MHIHRWTKWSEPRVIYVLQFSMNQEQKTIQTRRCLKCNMYQVNEMAAGVIDEDKNHK